MSGAAAFTVTSSAGTPVDKIPTVDLLPRGGCDRRGNGDDHGISQRRRGGEVGRSGRADVIEPTPTAGTDGRCRGTRARLPTEPTSWARPRPTRRVIGTAAVRTVTVANSGPVVVFSSGSTLQPAPLRAGWRRRNCRRDRIAHVGARMERSGDVRMDVRVAATKAYVGANLERPPQVRDGQPDGGDHLPDCGW